MQFFIPFATTWLCESGFSSLIAIETKSLNWLNIKDDMRIYLCLLRPRKLKAITQWKLQHMSYLILNKLKTKKSLVDTLNMIIRNDTSNKSLYYRKKLIKVKNCGFLVKRGGGLWLQFTLERGRWSKKRLRAYDLIVRNQSSSIGFWQWTWHLTHARAYVYHLLSVVWSASRRRVPYRENVVVKWKPPAADEEKTCVLRRIQYSTWHLLTPSTKRFQVPVVSREPIDSWQNTKNTTSQLTASRDEYPRNDQTYENIFQTILNDLRCFFQKRFLTKIIIF